MMAFDLKRFTELGLPNVSLFSPLLLALALGSCIWAAASVHTAMSTIGNRKALASSENNVSIKKEPASAAQVLSSAQRLVELAPAVQVQVSGASMVISIKDLARFSDWLNAMSAAQSTLAGYHWEAEQICMAGCSGGIAASASIKAFRPTFVVRNQD